MGSQIEIYQDILESEKKSSKTRRKKNRAALSEMTNKKNDDMEINEIAMIPKHFEISESLNKQSRSLAGMTGHMIRSGLLEQAVKLITSAKFILDRMQRMGIYQSVEAQLNDCKLLERKINKLNKKKALAQAENSEQLVAAISPLNEESEAAETSFTTTMIWKEEENITVRPSVISSSSASSSSASISTVSLLSLDMTESKPIILKALKKKMKCVATLLASVDLDTYECDYDDDPSLQILREIESAYNAVGNFCFKKEWYPEALSFFRNCLFVRFEAQNSTSENEYVSTISSQEEFAIIGNALYKIGEIEAQKGSFHKALRAFDAAINKLKISGDMVEVAKVFNRIGDIHGAQGNLQNSLEAYKTAVKIQKEELGNFHVSVAETLHNIGVVHRHQERLEKALENYKEALCILEQNGEDNLDIARTLNNIGSIYRRKGNYDKAMEYFADVLKVRRKIQGDYHASVNLTLIHYAKALRLQGDMNEALKFYDEAMK